MVVALVLLTGPVSAPSASASAYTSEELAFVQLINDYRVSLGLGQLKISDMLSEAGDRHSSDMAKYGFFNHYTERSDWFAAGTSPWDRMAASGYSYNTRLGENIAGGQRTAAEVFQAWKNSPTHNENMIDPNFKVIGVSLIYDSDSTYRYYWTTDFGGFVDPTAHALGSSVPSTPTSTGTGATGFSDVGKSTLYADEIKLLAKLGVVSGYSDGRFGPYDRVTRQQFAKMIVLSLGCAVSPISSSSFRDVATSAGSSDPLYPAGYVETCAAQGITVGKTPFTFCPYDNITRAQLITMVARAANLPEPPRSYQPPFPEFSEQHYPWARKAAYAGWLDGLVGMGPSFDFWAPATRGEVCLLLASLVER
jgi:uncharacterized protein YkwD